MTTPLPSRGPRSPDPRRPRHGTTLIPSRAPRIVLVTLLALLLSGATFAGTAYYEFSTRLQNQSSDISELLGTSRPDHGDRKPTDSWEGQALNLLVLGSDSRDEENQEFGSADGMRSDTAMIVHVAADRSRVEIVSIPRDLIVEIPPCLLPSGEYSNTYPLGTNEFNGVRFNAAFSIGSEGEDIPYGAACAIRTVENMTNVFIDDWAVVDMDGFRTMVDAIGGVDMCIEEAIDNRWAKLSLEPGCQTLDGEQALGFARLRKGIGDGSDIARIDRQQQLMGSMADQTLSAGVLANPSKLLPLLNSVASSLHTSERLGNLNNLAGLAYSLRDLDSPNIIFITPPLEYTGNVVVQTEQMQQVWNNLREDLPVPPEIGEDPEEGELDPPEGDSLEEDDSL